MTNLINSGALIYEYTESGAISKVLINVNTSLPDDFLINLIKDFLFNIWFTDIILFIASIISLYVIIKITLKFGFKTGYLFFNRNKNDEIK